MGGSAARRSMPAVEAALGLACASLLLGLCAAGDPVVYFDWDLSYITVAPLGVKQQVIAINGQFPGPIVNVTTNYNLVVNVQNDLDEPALITWNGIQHRKNSWQDGVLGTNCPIPSGWNWTYQFQVKDQIGSFFYFPSINFQRAAGGYGGIIVNNRAVIAVPFGKPDGDITIYIGDWYNRNHKVSKHKNLVHGFLRNASHMIRQDGEIHISHKTSFPFCQWKLEELASSNSLVLFKCVDFKIEDYPGYNNKREDGPRCDHPFPLGECCTFMFQIGKPLRRKRPAANVADLGGMVFSTPLPQRGSNSNFVHIESDGYALLGRERPPSFVPDYYRLMLSHAGSSERILNFFH